MRRDSITLSRLAFITILTGFIKNILQRAGACLIIKCIEFEDSAKGRVGNLAFLLVRKLS